MHMFMQLSNTSPLPLPYAPSFNEIVSEGSQQKLKLCGLFLCSDASLTVAIIYFHFLFSPENNFFIAIRGRRRLRGWEREKH